MKSYSCETCGAKLIVNSDEHFTKCLYCGNNIAIKTKDFKDLNVKKIIPFSVQKDDVLNMLKKEYHINGIDAKKVYVPVRLSKFNFSYLYFFKYRSQDSEGNVTYHDKEVFLDVKVNNEFIFGDSQVNDFLFQDELETMERLDFDPVIIDDVSIEVSNFNKINLKDELEKRIKRFISNKYKNYDIVKVYNENAIINDTEVEPFSTLIPIYIVKTKDGSIYNVPGVNNIEEKNSIDNLGNKMFMAAISFYALLIATIIMIFVPIPIGIKPFVIIIAIIILYNTYKNINGLNRDKKNEFHNYEVKERGYNGEIKRLK